MSTSDSGLADLADAGSEVVAAAVTAAAESPRGRDGWSNNKVLLAVLPPTLALLSVGIGVWENGNRDRAAAKSAQEAIAAQVAKDQAAAERAQQLREAELVLPKYENLLSYVHGTMSALHRCSSDIDAFNIGSTGWGPSIGTAIFSIPTGDGMDFVTAVGVGDAPFVESCSLIDATLDPFELSLDTALLVSNPALSEGATKLAEDLDKVTATARHLRAAVRDDIIPLEQTDSEGKTFQDVVEDLKVQLNSADAAAESLVTVVRGVLLLEK